jgi:hypothetical protein
MIITKEYFDEMTAEAMEAEKQNKKKHFAQKRDKDFPPEERAKLCCKAGRRVINDDGSWSFAPFRCGAECACAGCRKLKADEVTGALAHNINQKMEQGKCFKKLQGVYEGLEADALKKRFSRYGIDYSQHAGVEEGTLDFLLFGEEKILDQLDRGEKIEIDPNKDTEEQIKEIYDWEAAAARNDKRKKQFAGKLSRRHSSPKKEEVEREEESVRIKKTEFIISDQYEELVDEILVWIGPEHEVTDAKTYQKMIEESEKRFKEEMEKRTIPFYTQDTFKNIYFSEVKEKWNTNVRTFSLDTKKIRENLDIG